MRRSLIPFIVFCCVGTLVACASRKASEPPKPPPKPVYAGRTATLDITNDIQIVGSVRLPAGFAADPAYSPVWMQQGQEVAVVGNAGGKTVVLGFRGNGLTDTRVVAEDFGVSAPDGRIVDIAASPDGLELATAVADSTQNEIDVVLRENINPGKGHPIASVDGNFDFAQLHFLDNGTLALALRTQSPSQGNRASADTAAANGGIYVIGTTGQVTVRHLDKIQCPVSRLSFSPNGGFAVGEGDAVGQPAIFNLRDQTCGALNVRGPVKVLSWVHDSSAFLYRAYSRDGGVAVFRFDMTSGRSSLIAISSGAATFAGDGTIVTVGNSQLTWQKAHAGARVKAEVALIDPHTAQITLNSLGFETTAAQIAASTMVYSTASDDGVIDIAIEGGVAGILRELIEYSYPAHAAFVLASGPGLGPITMSWAPDGKLIAIVDGNQSFSMLTVLAPPR